MGLALGRTKNDSMGGIWIRPSQLGGARGSAWFIVRRENSLTAEHEITHSVPQVLVKGASRCAEHKGEIKP